MRGQRRPTIRPSGVAREPSIPQVSEDVIDLVDALIEGHVDFLLVGAHALAAHGIVRGTSDEDVERLRALR